MSLASLIVADARRTYENVSGPAWVRALKCALSPGVQAAVVYRLGHWLMTQAKAVRVFGEPVYAVLSFAIKAVWGIHLPRSARIGAGLYIGHFGGIIVSPLATIGRNCNLSHDVTIGASGSGAKRGVPTLGDDVYIAPGAKIFGRIHVGDNVKIGANAVVYKDVPANAILVLDPGFRIISMKGNRPVENNGAAATRLAA